MAKQSGTITESGLRLRMRRFLSARSSERSEVVDVLREIQKNWDAYVFGGVPRDLLVGPRGTRPRDIDLVVDSPSVDEIEQCLSKYVTRRTRFGGLHLDVAGWPLDIWPIRKTWALQEFPDQFQTVCDLPRTTFFNVEAVVIALGPRNSRGRTIYSYGFFNALRSRVLELNFAENPFPALCVVRSLYTAAKLRFAIGPRLARYLAESSDRVSLSEVLDAERSHYGCPRFHRDEIARWWDHVATEHQRRPDNVVTLPIQTNRQLQLWDSLIPPAS